MGTCGRCRSLQRGTAHDHVKLYRLPRQLGVEFAALSQRIHSPHAVRASQQCLHNRLVVQPALSACGLKQPELLACSLATVQSIGVPLTSAADVAASTIQSSTTIAHLGGLVLVEPVDDTSNQRGYHSNISPSIASLGVLKPRPTFL